MADTDIPYQQGLILHQAVVGAFRATGRSFEKWAIAYGSNATNVRNATLGMSKGPRGLEVLRDVIEAAGPELVRVAYLKRLDEHIAEVTEARARHGR